MASQKALLYDPESGKWAVGATSVPAPGPGDILIKVYGASCNPVDWKAPKYKAFLEEFPAILGMDIAGEVQGLGQGVTDFKLGDRVVLQGQLKNSYAGFQQYALGVASTAAKIPFNISYDEAATLPVALTASYVGLYNQPPHGIGLVEPVSPEGKGKYAGTPIFILGGPTSVGQNAIQLAKLSGFSPIITTASLKHAEYLKSLGATNVIDRNLSTAALASEINNVTQNAPIKYAFDCISSEDTQQTAYNILSPGGKLAVTLPITVKEIEEKEIFAVQGFTRLPQNAALLEAMYHDHLEGLLKEGHIKPNLVEVLADGLAGIPAGLARLEADQISRSKLVAHPQETA